VQDNGWQAAELDQDGRQWVVPVARTARHYMEVWSSVSGCDRGNYNQVEVGHTFVSCRADDLDPANSRHSPAVRNMEMGVGLTLHIVVCR
jgi:hypothetical protein